MEVAWKREVYRELKKKRTTRRMRKKGRIPMPMICQQRLARAGQTLVCLRVILRSGKSSAPKDGGRWVVGCRTLVRVGATPQQ